MKNQVHWNSVNDLSDDWEKLASPELRSLRDVWQEQAQRLRDNKALVDFNARLSREWAIETGILERLYTIDEGVSRLLVERGLHASLIPHGATDRDPNYVLNLIRDQHEVVDWLFSFVRDERKLSTSFVKEIHQLMTRHQQVVTAQDQFGNKLSVKLIRGEWRKQVTKIDRIDEAAYECCSPEQIASAMDNLLSRVEQHRINKVPAEVEAAWLHHQFTQIHPFQDGNGRVARALATLEFLREGYFPLVVRRGDREEYLKALYYADAGDISILIDLFAKLQRRAFVEALGISREVLTERAGLEEIVAAATDRLKEKARERERRMSMVFSLADDLFDIAQKRFHNTALIVHNGVSKLKREYRCWADGAKNDDSRDDYFHFQVVSAAKQLNYFANTRSYRAWIRLAIHTEVQTQIIISFHCIGSEFQGVMVASAFTFRRERSGEDTSALSGVDVLDKEPFLFNYNDTTEVLSTRFGNWVDQMLTLGLDHWRRTL